MEFTAKFSLPTGLIVRTLNSIQQADAKAIGIGPGENEAIVLARDMLLPLIMDDTSPQRVAMKLDLDVRSSLEFVRAVYISCFINRDEYEERLTAYDQSGRVSKSYVQWAMNATKVTS
jgi:predicted nucleic acid-binding protein